MRIGVKTDGMKSDLFWKVVLGVIVAIVAFNLLVIGPDNLGGLAFRLTIGVLNGIIIAVMVLTIRWLWSLWKGRKS